MAGIGFTLQKLFKDEYYSSRMKAYMYSAIVSAGPWIAAVITVNILLFISDYYFPEISERDLFMGTIVYSFVFSQIITAPWQFVITRYISDKLYTKDYRSIKASFTGLSKLISIISLLLSIIFYINTDLPIYYKFMAIFLFVFISLLWIVMVYLSAIKNYSIISYAYIIGGIVSITLAFIFYKYRLMFGQYNIASSILLAYLVGLIITYSILLYSFMKNFLHQNNKEYDFLQYLNKYSSLFFIGLFYTLGLWVDDLIMWYSELGVDVHQTYKYAPLYDNAVFLAYLTIIPTMILFMVQIETEFYSLYKKYFGLATKNGTLEEIEVARIELRNSTYRQLIYTMEVQTIISLTLIVLSGLIFSYLNIPLIVRDIFRIASLGALCNIFVLVIILILLYFEGRKESVLISLVFFSLNMLFTFYFIPKGVDYYGFGYFIGSFLALILALIVLRIFMKNINYNTFGKQPIFVPEEKGIFVQLASHLNHINKNKNKKILFNVLASISLILLICILIIY